MPFHFKLLAGLTVCTLIPLLLSVSVLSPGTTSVIISVAVALIFIVPVWFFLIKDLKSGRQPVSSVHENDQIQKQQSPNISANHIALTVEQILAEHLTLEENAKNSIIRQELRGRLTELFENPYEVFASGEAKEVTVILSDLRGFTSITENFSALEVLEMLNNYFTCMCEVIYRHGGMVDKFVGDSIMALFGAPVEGYNDVENALSCAIEMQIAMNRFNEQNKKQNLPDMYMGIGINTGKVIAGKVGSALHSEYTVIGNEINQTSRIEAYTLRGQILISENTYTRAKDLVKVKGPIHISVKGTREPLCIYELLGLKAPYNLKVPEREVRRSLRMNVNIPLKYQICVGKIISEDIHEGRIVNISSGGILIYTFTEIQQHQNIKFRLGSEIIGIQGDDIYGKVVNVKKRTEMNEANIEFTAIDSKDSLAIKEFVMQTFETSRAFSK